MGSNLDYTFLSGKDIKAERPNIQVPLSPPPLPGPLPQARAFQAGGPEPQPLHRHAQV